MRCAFAARAAVAVRATASTPESKAMLKRRMSYPFLRRIPLEASRRT